MQRGLARSSVGYVHYRAGGPAIHTGPPLVLLHGQVKSSAIFLELMEALEHDMPTIAVDLPSCGASDHVPDGLLMPDYARIVREVLDTLGVTRARALGQAGGARVAAHLAIQFPDLVEKVVLVNCAWWGGKEAEERTRAARNAVAKPLDANGAVIPRTLQQHLELDAEHCPMQPTEDWAERINLAALQAGRDCMQVGDASHADDWSNLARVRCPVLNLWGEHFKYARHRDEFSRLVGDGVTAIIPGARFDPWVDHAADVRRQVLSFLSSR